MGTIIDLVKLHHELKLVVHVVTVSRGWFNGKITEIHPTFLVLDEFQKGTLPILFAEIVSIDKYARKNR
jgi:hypothetical protein